jgi:hypothetical protein
LKVTAAVLGVEGQAQLIVFEAMKVATAGLEGLEATFLLGTALLDRL